MGKEVVIKSGFSSTTVIFFIFLALKLSGYITWSWWWVTSPLWLGWAIIGGIFIIIGLIALLVALFNR